MSPRTPRSKTTRRTRKAAGRQAKKRGLPPGSPIYVGEPRTWETQAQVLEYRPDGCSESAGTAQLAGTPPSGAIRWLDVTGIHDADFVAELGRGFGLHPLVVEDILNPSSLPKHEAHGSLHFVITRMLTLAERVEGEGPRVLGEQIALAQGPGWLLSFQEQPGDVFDPVRQRIRTGAGRIRSLGADYLLHALLDAVVDRYFEVLVALEDEADGLSQRALTEPPSVLVVEAQKLRAEISVVRRAALPLRDAVGRILSGAEETLAPKTAPYFGDLHDHLVQAIQLAEGARDLTQAAIELSLAAASNRMNEVMRVLTVIASIFIPLTFVAGIYGMNFEHMPELGWPWAYPALLTLLGTIALGMIGYFRRRGWL